uniref:PlsC domain-containing protein n=1 Tax=Macrostomum lignano TaxID=282301 RepID=A0A1I8JS49_9PLAT
NRLIENLQTELQLKNQQLEEQSCELRQTKSEQRQTEALLANESAMKRDQKDAAEKRICLESQLSRMKAEVERLNSELNIGGCSLSRTLGRPTKKTGRPRKGVFEDLVDERRQRGDLGWVLRTRRSVPSPAFCAAGTSAASAAIKSSKSPADINRDVLSSDRLTYGLREISLETGRPMPELMSEAGAILDEMSHCLSMFAIRSFGYAVAKVMKRIYRGVFVNTEGITQLRKACSEYPVVLMPMHRSYADFLLLSLVCYDYDLPLPAIASAMDFMGMQLIGSILRNCGAFFIRRSFATDRVYWLTFVEYVKTHVRDGLHPVEFFIEGTRSRTGKSLYPKTAVRGSPRYKWAAVVLVRARL